MISFPSSSSNPSTSRSGSKKKPSRNSNSTTTTTKWRTGVQERIYNRRLADALKSARDRAESDPIASRAVKEAADSALALTARGQSRWSRAILLGSTRRSRLLVKAGGKIRRPRRAIKRAASGSAEGEPGEPVGLKGRKVRERLGVLGRLVPGCKKLGATDLLDEVVDYVPALEMQVSALRKLVDALSAAALTAGAPAEMEEDRSLGRES